MVEKLEELAEKLEDFEVKEALEDFCKKIRKKKIATVAIFVTVVIVLGMVWGLGFKSAQDKSNAKIEELTQKVETLENTPVVVDPVTPEIVQKVFSENMAGISELATAEYLFTNAAKFTDTSHIIKILDWMTEKSFVQKWDGKIKAGIKMEKVTIEVKNNIITITMPYAEILSYEIDYSSVEVLDEKNNIFNQISVNDKVNFDRETKYSMEARAVENGLLEKAQANAKATIAEWLTASIKNVQDYQIEFKVVDAG